MSIFEKMVKLQHQFNKQVAEDYLEKDFNWNSAIIAESGELLDSLGYKWWKKQEPDMENVKVEAIDLLHFVISEEIQRHHRNFDKSERTSDKFVVSRTIQIFEKDFAEDNILIYKDFKELIDLLNYREEAKFSRSLVMYFILQFEFIFYYEFSDSKIISKIEYNNIIDRLGSFKEPTFK